MSQGLALNDDLQRVLAKHDAIAAGIAVRVEKKPKSLQALVETEDSANQDSKKEQGLIDIEDPTSQDAAKVPNQRFASITVAYTLNSHNVYNYVNTCICSFVHT